MASFRDILAERRKSGAGLGSSLKTAFSERAKEKLDPRNYLFAKGGMATALFPKLTGYKAKLGTEKIKRNVGSDSIAVEPVIMKLDELNMQFRIVTKNSMSLPGMARDMNIMRQNIVKLVSKLKVKRATSADEFFMDASRKESAYEQLFGSKSYSPTAAGKAGKDKGFLRNLLGGGISSFIQSIVTGLLKGGLLVVVAEGIGKYITDPEFRKTVNETVDKFMTNLFGEEWAKNLLVGLGALGLGFAALNTDVGSLGKLGFKSLELLLMGLSLVGGGLKKLGPYLLQAVKLFARLAPAIATILALVGPTNRDTDEDQQISAKREEMGLKDSVYSEEEEEARREALEELKALESSTTGNDKGITGKFSPGVYKSAKQQRIDELKDIIDPTRKYDRASNSPTSMTFPTANIGERAQIEEYLGRKISDTEFGLLLKAVYAESSRNKNEYARVMAVILNRTRTSGASIQDVIEEPGQFESVTGLYNKTTKTWSGPSANYTRGPDSKSLNMILDSTEELPGVSKKLDSFTSANRKLYEKEGRNAGFLDKLLGRGGEQFGGTVFANGNYVPSQALKNKRLPVYTEPNSGNVLNEMSTEFMNSFRGGAGTTNVNNTTNNITKNDSGGGGAVLAADGPYNSDLAKTFFGR